MADESVTTPDWTPEQLRAFAQERLSEDIGGGLWEMPEGSPPPGPNPIDENDRELAAGR